MQAGMQHGRAEDLDVQRAAGSGLSPVRQVYSPGPRRADMQTRPDRTRRAERAEHHQCLSLVRSVLVSRQHEAFSHLSIMTKL